MNYLQKWWSEKYPKAAVKEAKNISDGIIGIEHLIDFEKWIVEKLNINNLETKKMEKVILERLKKEFNFIGHEKISGHEAMKIINEIIEELTIPKEVKQAQKYVAECHRDIGFMGSPEYDRQRAIIDMYFAPIKQKQIENEEILIYLRLKSKYDS